MFKFGLLVVGININLLLCLEIFDIFKKCKMSDKTCLKNSIENGVLNLANGLQEIDLPVIDPYIFGNVGMDLDGFSEKYSNLTFFGFVNIDILNIEIDLEPCRIEFDFLLPSTRYDSVIHWNGTLDNKKINLTKFASVLCADCKVYNLLNCKVVKNDSVEYLEVVDGQTDFQFGDVTFDFKNSGEDNPGDPKSEIRMIQPLADKCIEWFDLEACQIKFDFGLPNTVYENTFHWKGIIDGNEINIVSIMRMPCANSKSVNVFNCKIVKKDDVEYLEIVDGTTDFHFGDVGFEISHFSKDNIEPNSNFNEYVNKHSQTEIPLIEQMANKNIGWLVRFLRLQEIDLPPLDPYFFGNSVTDADGFLQEYSNLTYFGFTFIDVKEIEIDMDVCRIKLELKFPKVRFEAISHWKGSLDGNKINSKYFVKMYCDNNVVKTMLNCKKIKKDDEDFIEIVENQTDFHYGNVTFDFEDLVEGKRNINKNFTDFVNKDSETEYISGLKEINLPPLDPYFFGNSVMDMEGFLQEYSNLMFFGFTLIDVKKIEIDLDPCRIQLEFELPKIRCEAISHWRGSLDGDNIDSNYFIRMYCDNNKVKTSLNCKKVKKFEDDYIEIVDGKSDFHFGNVTFDIEDIVKGKQEVNKNFTNYVNKNSETELTLTKPVADKNVEWFIQFVTDKILSEIPLSELFLN
ncbi:hypothetical protein FQR65_LT03641 [Abscondita terminalis]|nr:hypothetical protein FQR65_LT03641 [Abscondita terminalis]